MLDSRAERDHVIQRGTDLSDAIELEGSSAKHAHVAVIVAT
jgi:hypothetical protein